MTRWALQLAWLAKRAPLPHDDGRAALQTPSQRSSCDSAAVLAAMVADDLQRGYVRLAIRHYLMLEALGGAMCPEQRRACLALIERCPVARLARIRQDVVAWHGLVLRSA